MLHQNPATPLPESAESIHKTVGVLCAVDAGTAIQDIGLGTAQEHVVAAIALDLSRQASASFELDHLTGQQMQRPPCPAIWS